MTKLIVSTRRYFGRHFRFQFGYFTNRLTDVFSVIRLTGYPRRTNPIQWILI